MHFFTSSLQTAAWYFLAFPALSFAESYNSDPPGHGCSRHPLNLQVAWDRWRNKERQEQ